MKNDVALTLTDVHISYKSIKKFKIKRIFSKDKIGQKEYFEAVKGISFKLNRGEILGIIGKNGSGKTTLLRAISGIFSADKGEINLHGNSVSLLSIGVGFQNNLSGYENIFLSGMLLGFREKEIKEKINEIIEFSELGDFIYKPVRTYSSGMYSKLAFSITSILETDIMLIDEILSVGDIAFKNKSFNKMKELISNKDRTVLIVSHNLDLLKELCDKVLWVDNGTEKMYGDTATVIGQYIKFMENK